MILNLTQHAASPEQLAAGVVDLAPELRARLQALLTFTSLPSADAVEERALAIVQMAHDWSRAGCDPLCRKANTRAGQGMQPAAMIGGAPYLMAPLERALGEIGIEPVYSYTERVGVEERQPDGTVRMMKVFRHLGFVPGAHVVRG